VRVAIDADGVLMDVAHHQSVTVVSNKSMPLQRALRFDTLSAGLHQGEDDVILRAHAHVDGFVGDGFRLAASIPCWKIQDDFAAGSKEPNAWLSPWLGALLIETDGDAKREGRECVRLTRLYYKHPELPRYTL
jgi:hypothetical protein